MNEQKAVIFSLLALAFTTIFLGPTGCVHRAPKTATPVAVSTAIPAPDAARDRSTLRRDVAVGAEPTTTVMAPFKVVFEGPGECDSSARVRSFIVWLIKESRLPKPKAVHVDSRSVSGDCTKRLTVEATVSIVYPASGLDQKLREGLAALLLPFKPKDP